MQKLSLIVLFGLMPSFAGCSKPDPATFGVVGWNQPEVMRDFGNPDGVDDRTVQSYSSYFGPRPAFISELPITERVEVWRYDVDGGYIELFFYKSDRVREVILTPNDVMY